MAGGAAGGATAGGSGQLRNVQLQADLAAPGTVRTVDLLVGGVVVTAIKPAVLGADPAVDPQGFFVQADTTAIFVAATAPVPVVGDLVSFRVTGVTRAGGVRRVATFTDYNRVSSATLPTPIMLSGFVFSAGSGNRDQYESVLARVTNAPGAASSSDGGTQGFVSVPVSASSGIRLPAGLNNTQDLRDGCFISAVGPVWMSDPSAGLLSVFGNADLTGTTCGTPAFVGFDAFDAGPFPDAGSRLVISTSRFVDSATVVANRFTIVPRGSTTPVPVTGANLAGPAQIQLQTTLADGFEYTVSPSMVRDTRASAFPTTAVPFRAGACRSTAQVVISAINPLGPGEWIELHNRTNAPVDISGWQLAHVPGSGPAASAYVLTFPASTLIGAGRYFLIRTDAGGGGGPPADLQPATVNTLAAGGMLQLQTSGGMGVACTDARVIDRLSWGTGTLCPDAAPVFTFPSLNPESVRRDTRGCLDRNVMGLDFESRPGFVPRTSASPPETCLCP
jgi:hypothetical protein